MSIWRLKEIKIPTLIFTADFDSKLCIDIAELMNNQIAGSKLVVMKNAGHIMNMEKPAEFNKLMMDFIAGIKK
jgi:pimeloyl-ACP methyl ester carboxylesterase